MRNFIAGLIFLLLLSPRLSTPAQMTNSKGRPVAAGVTNDAELLITRCGKPSLDDSTAYDKPRPPIPSRIVEYKAQRLRIFFLPGGSARLGDPPPYKWKLFSILDTRTKKAVSPTEAIRRMPCWAGR